MITDRHRKDLSERAEFRLGAWIVSPASHQLRRNGHAVTLQNLSMQVLVYLADKAGKVVSYDELLDALWPGRVVGEDAVHRRIADLRQHLGDNSRKPEYIQTIPKRGYRMVARVQPAAAVHARRRPVATATAALVTLALVAGIRMGTSEHPSDFLAAIEAADAAISNDDIPTAYEAVRDWLATYPADPRLTKIRESVMAPVVLETSPPNAMVYYRPYGEPRGEWQPLGATPLETELPRRTWQLKFVADGHATTELSTPNPSAPFNNVNGEFFVVRLPAADEVPEGMVFIPGGKRMIPLFGFYRPDDLGDFLISRTEVSNRQYAEFVAEGGYREPRYWQDLDSDVSFDDVARLFVDSSGQPGPAGWAGGHYPPKSADLPVTGVSWYEAMAYARYRGMSLPTARHWARAALGVDEDNWPLARDLLEAAHLDGNGPLPVTDARATSTWGPVNLVGNVREWTTTRSGGARLSLGSGFRGPRWAYAFPQVSMPRQRNPDQGFRLAAFSSEVADPPLAGGSVTPDVPDVPDAEYAEYASLFAYQGSASGKHDLRQVYARDEQEWIREKIVIEPDRGEEALPVLIFRPRDSVAPLQPVIFLPHGGSYSAGFPSDDIDLERFKVDFIVRSGRALIWPIILGTHERFQPRPQVDNEEFARRWLTAKQTRREEIGKTIDFLVTSERFDGGGIALLAASFGASIIAPHILATEPRIKAAVLMSASLVGIRQGMFPNSVNPNTYWPRVTTPVLLLNGRYDIAAHATESRELLFETIGAEPKHKRSILYDSSHWPLPQHRVRQDTLAWLDQFLGPVE